MCCSAAITHAQTNVSIKEVITLLVFKSDRAKFKKEPTELYANKRICVTGKVSLYKDKLQIVVNEPKQVKIN
ncbi:hypothetical protein [Pedobacter sp.]